MEPANDGRENVLILTDLFFKYTQAIPTKDQRASAVAETLMQHWFYLFGVPARIHSDQGKNKVHLFKNSVKCTEFRKAAQHYIIHKVTVNANILITLYTTYSEHCLQRKRNAGPSTCHR